MTLSFGPTPLLHDCFELCKENTLQPRLSRQMHRYQNSCLRATSNCHVCKDLITAITPMLRFRLYSGEVSCLEAQISLSAEWQRSCGALLAKNCLDRTTSFFLYFFGRVGGGGGGEPEERRYRILLPFPLSFFLWATSVAFPAKIQTNKQQQQKLRQGRAAQPYKPVVRILTSSTPQAPSYINTHYNSPQIQKYTQVRSTNSVQTQHGKSTNRKATFPNQATWNWSHHCLPLLLGENRWINVRQVRKEWEKNIINCVRVVHSTCHPWPFQCESPACQKNACFKA